MSNQNRLPRAAALHDLSCVGRCALTVILPTLAAMGIQPIPLPTALLSTHTGGFTDLFFADLTDEMEKIAAHWKTLSLDFDAIYTGFLGSAPQIDTVSRFIGEFGEGALILVDPVMGDDGLLYSTYTPEMVNRVRELCAHADLITPNLTEACLLCGLPYRDTAELSAPEVRDFADELLDRLSHLDAPAVLLTGLPHGGVISVAGSVEGDRFCFSHERVSAGYPGTGDLFASVLLGRLLRQRGKLTADRLQTAADFAAHFTGRAIAHTLAAGTPVRDGVLLEALLGELI
ncbi:MAG: pyridoxamine kinase [Clostridia bacterium]|nr:pyridoxamine kinase [Clostridia bacterium]